jgi:hypothetical protein
VRGEIPFRIGNSTVLTVVALCRNAHDATDETHKWQTTCANAQQQVRALAEQLTTTQDDHDRTTRQYTRTLEQLNVSLQTLRTTSETLREQLTKREAHVEELKRANELLARDRKRVTDELARTGDHLRSPGGGSPLATVGAPPPTGVSGLFGSTPADQQNLKRVLQDYECQASKLESANEDLRRELQRQQQQLASVKQSTQAQHCFKLEKEVKKLREALSDKTTQLADHEAELLRTRGSLKEREALIRDMKDEYNKLFTAMQKIKQQAPTQARPLARTSSSSQIGLNHTQSPGHTKSPAEKSVGDPAVSETTSVDHVRAQANENPYLLGHYKAQIEQQEKVIERLQIQLRKMIASEYQHKQKNRQFRVERVELKDTCDSLRGELERAVKITAKAMAQHIPLFGDGDGGDSHLNLTRSANAHQLRPEEDGSDDDERGGSSNQLCCTIADVRRLRERNQYLEARFRATSEIATAATRPPRPSRSSSVSGMGASASAAQIAALPRSSERSIDATTMQALQQVKQHSARARQQSAGPRPLLSRSSSVVTKSLL